MNSYENGTLKCEGFAALVNGGDFRSTHCAYCGELERDHDHSEPTYSNQLFHARKLLQDKGRDALISPHALTGKVCGCGSCFCCAALQVLRESDRMAQS